MPRRPITDAPKGMQHNDPRRPLKIRRLREEHARIASFTSRAPSLDDSDFEEWENAVHSLLMELFGANEFVLRFKQLTFRPISYQMGGGKRWNRDPAPVWEAAFQSADKLLREALEEAEIVVPSDPLASALRRSAPAVHVVVNNNNAFSPTVHITVEQLLSRLDSAPLSQSEKAEVRDCLKEIDVEAKGAKRWQIIARSVEAIKSVGKGVYKDFAVPLIVEFLKRESGLSSDV